MLNIDEVQIASLPSLPLAERWKLPECAAVYFAVSENGEVLYIGRTVQLLDRWRAHHRLPDLDGTVSIAWLVVDNTENLSDMERGLIDRFRPSLNWLRRSGRRIEESLTVAFRIPEWARRHYEAVAEKERRNLSQVLRLVLEDHAKGQCKNGRKKAA